MTQIEQDAQKFLPILTALAPILLQVENSVFHDERGYGIKLGGFYKDGSVTIRPAVGDGTMGQPLYVITGRYEELTEVWNGEDLLEEVIRLNASRFSYWNSVKPEFSTIDSTWLPLLKARGMVEDVVTVAHKIR